ncbi:hypothetical protein BOTNAR_0186g00120 [Botryotinia narcissicola]|uniref:2EXR domain-containing protein n=1 Tax=Botryotinia narcissicola TaxID=278944 RepID=A0A4Z1IN60_9HELO|nr:hypothetical protein BOTNAR_0186g00120 [Botryotinia narcissicola]
MSEPPKSSTFFSDLPIGLRLVIWILAISPRAVVVLYNYTKKSCVSKDVPSLLLVSRESRAEALHKYEISLGTRTKVIRPFTSTTNLTLLSLIGNHSEILIRGVTCLTKKNVVASNESFAFFQGVEEVSISGYCGGVVKSREKDFLARSTKWLMDDMEYYPVESGRLLPRLHCLDAGWRSRLSKAFVVSAVE